MKKLLFSKRIFLFLFLILVPEARVQQGDFPKLIKNCKISVSGDQI